MLEAAFYGDDFTGSTDALLQFERCGLRSVLLVELPPADELRDLATRYDVIGVAGIARSLAPHEQEAEIRPILIALRDLDPRIVQYKICSTADSSPRLGSIGRALEVGRSVFGPAVVPVLAAQPELGRYTVFSHHFAAEAGTIHRLDRQPTMANHPATPTTEADLRVHLAAQTALEIGALHLTSYADLPNHYPHPTADAVILDALSETDLHLLGQTLIASSNGRPTFAIGSGGLSRALALNLAPTPPTPSAATLPSAPLGPATGPTQGLVVSGSQSARTRQQIEYAVNAGWLSLELHDPTSVRRTAVAALRDGTPGVVVHTGERTTQPIHNRVNSLGKALAEVTRAVVEEANVRRVLIAGGDTSGHIVRNFGVRTLELVTATNDFGPGTALCRLTSPHRPINGLEVLLKGGQMGTPDLFETFRTQTSATAAAQTSAQPTEGIPRQPPANGR
ncbi:four-carbon acid sugar kinase family protein [Kribbella sp. NPDC049174]|uniref:four-carbon acid sugar kinase family protein n=1 Tax=Kribbella sp. NPDC049174 TaxID=3364112 RepID=UPI003718DABC